MDSLVSAMQLSHITALHSLSISRYQRASPAITSSSSLYTESRTLGCICVYSFRSSTRRSQAAITPLLSSQNNSGKSGSCNFETNVKLFLSPPWRREKLGSMEKRDSAMRCMTTEEMQTEKPVDLSISSLPLALFPVVEEECAPQTQDRTLNLPLALAMACPVLLWTSGAPAAIAMDGGMLLQGVPLADIDPGTARIAITVLAPLFTALNLLFIVRIVMSWYPQLPVGKFPFVIAYAPTEPILGPTRRLIPPVGGVDVSPVIWVALMSFLNEVLLGQQGLLVLLSQQQP